MSGRRNKGKAIRIVVFLLLFGTFAFFAGRYILYIKIRDAIENELGSLKKQGIIITYDDFEVFAWDGRIDIHELKVKVRKDSLVNDSIAHGLDAYLPYITIEGIDPFPFLREKTLSIGKIHSFETYVTYCTNSTLVGTGKSAKRQIEVNNIEIDNISFPRIDLYLTEETQDDTIAHILSDVYMTDLFLAKQLDSLTWQKGEVLVSDFAMNYTKEYYGVSVRNARIGITNRSIDIDSFLVKPVLSRDKFMKAKGKQIDYIEAFIPSLKFRGIDWYTFPSPTLRLDKMDIQLVAKLYRDKRMPFRQSKEIPLPAHLLHRIPVSLTVDTLEVKKSFVSYEEMPEHGDSTGLIFFDELNARILHLHNNNRLNVDSRMHATARFMGAGDLDAHFTFPHDTLQPYRVAGTLRNMRMSSVNKMLGAAAMIKVESGTMRNLKFNFTYNNNSSSGDVSLDYEGLKVLSLRQNRKNEQSVSRIKTALLNALVLGKKVNEQHKDDFRTGTVSFERDKQRSVFNYWWKSILSGVKSAYKLDKLPTKGNNSAKNEKKKRPLKEVLTRIFKNDEEKK